MQIPVQISFRGMDPSPAVELRVRERVDKLERFSDRITGCRVVVESPHRRHHQGKLYHVRVDLTVPGSEVAVTREPAEHHAHEDVYVAIRDAFDAAQRQLEGHVSRQRGDVKVHVELPHGRIAKLFPNDGYGFLETSDGREIYFHRNSLVDGEFEALIVGADVRFAEAMGERGPQASTVHVRK